MRNMRVQSMFLVKSVSTDPTLNLLDYFDHATPLGDPALRGAETKCILFTQIDGVVDGDWVKIRLVDPNGNVGREWELPCHAPIPPLFPGQLTVLMVPLTLLVKMHGVHRIEFIHDTKTLAESHVFFASMPSF
jgi:hypothetical protein